MVRIQVTLMHAKNENYCSHLNYLPLDFTVVLLTVVSLLN